MMRTYLLVTLAGAALLAQQAVAAAADGSSQDEAAIRRSAEAFSAAFNSGDLEAIARQWAEKGDLIDATGRAYQGRDAIVEAFKTHFAIHPDRRLEINIESIRFVTPDVALEDGTSTITPAPTGPSAVVRYTAVHVKRNNQWLTESVREVALEPPPAEQLEQLAWMIGDWVDEGDTHVVHTSCRWSENKNFILRQFEIKFDDDNVMKGEQRIGWDPLRKRIKSWVFDSSGSNGEGLWTRDGNRWVVKNTAVLADGRTASATSIIKYVDKDSFTWQSTNREIGGEPLPDYDEVTVRRRPTND